MQTSEDRIKELEAELEAEKTKSASGGDILVKMGNKQNVCVYNLGQRVPVTLYAPGWLKLAENIKQVTDFIEAHKDELSWER